MSQVSMFSPSGEVEISLPRFWWGRWSVGVRGAEVATGRSPRKFGEALRLLPGALRTRGLVCAADELQAIASAWSEMADAPIVEGPGA